MVVDMVVLEFTSGWGSIPITKQSSLLQPDCRVTSQPFTDNTYQHTYFQNITNKGNTLVNLKI